MAGALPPLMGDLLMTSGDQIPIWARREVADDGGFDVDFGFHGRSPAASIPQMPQSGERWGTKMPRLSLLWRGVVGFPARYLTVLHGTPNAKCKLRLRLKQLTIVIDHGAGITDLLFEG